MVLGVDRANQIKNIELAEQTDVLHQMVKPACNEVSRHGADMLCDKLISSADVFCIFGSSLGETDQTWWDKIANRVRDDNCRLVIFYYSPYANQVLMHREERLRRGILRKFFDEDELESISQKVYISFNSDIFDL